METERSDADAEAVWLKEQEAQIDAHERLPARLGEHIDTDFGDGTYVVSYDHYLFDLDTETPRAEQWPKGFPVEARIPDDEMLHFPQPPEGFKTEGRQWDSVWWPLISDREAGLAMTRLGKAKQRIARVALDSPHGVVLTGPDLGRAIERAYALFTGKDLQTEEGTIRSTFQAARSMGQWGFCHIFTDAHSVSRDETTYLIVPQPRLFEAVQAMLARAGDKPPEAFENRVGTPPMEEFDDGDAGAVISLWEAEDRKEARESAIRYAASRHVGAMEAEVRPTDKGYPTQPLHIIARSDFAVEGGSRGIRPRVVSFQLVSEIVTPSSLDDYAKVDPDAIASVIAEMRKRDRATNPDHVKAALSLLTEDDQAAVMEFVRCFLDTEAEDELWRDQFKAPKTGVDLITAAIGLIKTSRKQRAHVLLQIRLVAGDLVRDLMSLYMGQYHGTFVFGSTD